MEPTARARELIEPARRIIREVEETLLAPRAFDPALHRAFAFGSHF